MIVEVQLKFLLKCRLLPRDGTSFLHADTGSEERAQPSSEPRRSVTSSATPADSSLLQVPCPGRSHATSQSRTSSTIQREALSPGTVHSPVTWQYSKESSVYQLFLLLFDVLSALSCCSCTGVARRAMSPFV